LVNALRDEKEFSAVSQELAAFSKLLSAHKELTEILVSPFVPAKKRNQIIKDILAAFSFSGEMKRFICLLLDHNRLNLLGDILESLPVFWHEHKGVSTFEVSSVVSLTDAQKARLKAQLERLERRPVYLSYKIEPELVAGISLKKGNVVYDASIKGHLSKLKEEICEG
jgi:F-type H+-transporting ATPase subunit delta